MCTALGYNISECLSVRSDITNKDFTLSCKEREKTQEMTGMAGGCCVCVRDRKVFFFSLTSSLERRAFMWGILGSERGSWSTQSSRLSARARAGGTWWSRLPSWDVLEG